MWCLVDTFDLILGFLKLDSPSYKKTCGKYLRESKVQVVSSYPSAGLFLFVQEMDIVVVT